MKRFLLVFASLLLGSDAFSQIPVEVFAGNTRSTLDIMFFKYFKNHEGKSSRFLFFNRNRASVDYRMTSTSYLPQYGFTEAFSYNHSKLKGFAPVAVVQFLNRGVFPKAGIQFAHIKKDLLIFTWAVAELKSEPNLDCFLLLRYTPEINENLHLFTQMESSNAFPTALKDNFSFIQRLRIGLQKKEYQFGLGSDFTENGRNIYNNTYNSGVFLRHEF